MRGIQGIQGVVRSIDRQCRIQYKKIKAHHLGEDTLKEHLHHPARIREYGFDDLSLLRDCRTDLLEKHVYTCLVRR